MTASRPEGAKGDLLARAWGLYGINPREHFALCRKDSNDLDLTCSACWRVHAAVALCAEYAREQVEGYAKTVDDPATAHLHYDGCPYKPFADLPSHEEPENAPECTCAESHKGAYWKGQFVLERGYHSLTKNQLQTLRGENDELRKYRAWYAQAEGEIQDLRAHRTTLQKALLDAKAQHDRVTQEKAALEARERAAPELIVRAVAELPDRTSLEDQPEMMMVTSEELLDIVRAALAPRPRHE